MKNQMNNNKQPGPLSSKPGRQGRWRHGPSQLSRTCRAHDASARGMSSPGYSPIAWLFPTGVVVVGCGRCIAFPCSVLTLLQLRAKNNNQRVRPPSRVEQEEENKEATRQRVVGNKRKKKTTSTRLFLFFACKTR